MYEYDDCSDYESIDDIARGEGFFIDDDGHWRMRMNVISITTIST